MFIFQSRAVSIEKINFVKKVVLSQKQDIIAYPADFAVLEDGCYLITDNKDNKIILYDKDGRFLHSWKSLGQGPGEYQGPWWTDYRNPYLGIFDLRVQKLILYKRTGLTDFQWINDIFEPTGNVNNFKLGEDKVYFDASCFYKNRYYAIHITDFRGKNDEYYLPAAVKFGREPNDDYRKPYSEFAMVWGTPWSHIDVYNDQIYLAWKGLLNVVIVDTSANKWKRIGYETPNYSEPKIKRFTTNDFRGASEWRKENKTKYSWTNGVFADFSLIGIIYLKYNNNLAKWDSFLQLYDTEGNFKKEGELVGAQDIYERLRYHYSRETGCLYILNMKELSSGDVEFEMLTYQIRE